MRGIGIFPAESHKLTHTHLNEQTQTNSHPCFTRTGAGFNTCHITCRILWTNLLRLVFQVSFVCLKTLSGLSTRLEAPYSGPVNSRKPLHNNSLQQPSTASRASSWVCGLMLKAKAILQNRETLRQTHPNLSLVASQGVKTHENSVIIGLPSSHSNVNWVPLVY